MNIYLQYGRDVVWRHLLGRHLPQGSAESTSWFVDCRLPWNRYLTLTLGLCASHNSGLSVRFGPRHIIGPRTYAQYMDDYARLAFQLKGVRFVHQVPEDTSGRILVFDSEKDDLLAKPWARRIQLRYDVAVSRANMRNWMMAPYPMHPVRYFNGDDDRLEALRKVDRTIRVLFAGNVDSRAYASKSISAICQRFGYLNRAEWYSGILAAGLPLEHLGSDQQLLAMSEQVHDRILLATSERYRIPTERWLDTLAKANFFIAAPGVFMPVCHNAVEAMAVGTIPILMHDDWFHPPLIDRQNCLKLRRRDDLANVLRTALSMSQADVQAMRSNVVEYFAKHLDPSVFIKRVASHPARDVTVFFNFELPSEMERVTHDSVIIGEAEGISAPGVRLSLLTKADSQSPVGQPGLA